MSSSRAHEKQPTPISAACWCGNIELLTFGAGYLRCGVCETLVVENMPEPEDLVDTENDAGFYGRDNYETYQRQTLRLPSLSERARRDLPERCCHWLKVLLKYKQPPAAVLELGCSHGGFVAMLRAAGFAATGLEVSRSLADFATRTFGVPVLVGPIERQEMQSSTLDVVAMMDVLEHLPCPQQTLASSKQALRPDGIVLIQTPRYHEGKSLLELEETNDPFLYCLTPDQHLYLFSVRSIQLLLARCGFSYIQLEPAFFSSYDMFLAASAEAFPVERTKPIDHVLADTVESRWISALLDAAQRYSDLQARLLESEADRAARLLVIDRQGRQLIEIDSDRAAHVSLVQERDRRILELERKVAELQTAMEVGDRPAKTKSRKLEAARGALVFQERLSAEKEEPLLTRDDRLSSPIHSLSDELTTLRETNNKLADQLTTQESLRDALATAQSERAMSARRGHLLSRIHGSLVYKVMRALGFWGWLELSSSTRSKQTLECASDLSRVAIDLTPVLPGGANGGAKFLAVELVRNLALLAPECEFVLLTSSKGHDELAMLDAPNIQRICVDASWRMTYKSRELLQKRATTQPLGDLLAQAGTGLMFCPFTAPFHSDPRIPVVSLVLDLQHLYYPQFFEPADVAERDRHFQMACSVSAKVLCISEFVRETVLTNSSLSPGDVETVHICLQDRLTAADPTVADMVLRRYQVDAQSFLFYPANFWRHKNHELLLTSFGMYCAKHPRSKLKLVLTGTPGERMEYLSQASDTMGLSDRVIFAGFLPDAEVSALLRSSMALIFPSLYEGFGIPVLEAMSLGTPVLCGNLTSLPEVAGDAALYFDPRRPAEIVQAIEKLESECNLRRDLAARGLGRSKEFGTARDMAERYLKVFREVAGCRLGPGSLRGVYPDGWASGKVEIVVNTASGTARTLHVSAIAPFFIPNGPVHLKLSRLSEGSTENITLTKEQATEVVVPVDPAGSRFEITAENTFRPKDYKAGDDIREISFKLLAAGIQDGNSGIVSLKW